MFFISAGDLFNAMRLTDLTHAMTGSKNASELPLVFLLDSSAPSTMSYLHAAYSRSTVALLRVCVHNAPSGLDLANTVIEKVCNLLSLLLNNVINAYYHRHSLIQPLSRKSY